MSGRFALSGDSQDSGDMSAYVYEAPVDIELEGAVGGTVGGDPRLTFQDLQDMSREIPRSPVASSVGSDDCASIANSWDFQDPNNPGSGPPSDYSSDSQQFASIGSSESWVENPLYGSPGSQRGSSASSGGWVQNPLYDQDQRKRTDSLLTPGQAIWEVPEERFLQEDPQTPTRPWYDCLRCCPRTNTGRRYSTFVDDTYDDDVFEDEDNSTRKSGCFGNRCTIS